MFLSNKPFLQASAIHKLLVLLALWGAHVTTSVLLAVNRCFVISRPDLARELFGGRRTYYWLLAPASVFVVSLFPQPLMYNGVLFAYVVDPHLGYFDDYGIRVRFGVFNDGNANE